METQKETKREMLTITLTGRPPVRVAKGGGPVGARASDETYDGEYECQATRVTKWWLTVRRHADGRTLVYGVYDHDSQLAGEQNVMIKRGVLLAAQDATWVVETIRQ